MRIFFVIFIVFLVNINVYAHNEDLMLKMFHKVMNELQKCQKQNEQIKLQNEKIKKQNEEIKQQITELHQKVDKILNNQEKINDNIKRNFVVSKIETICKNQSLKIGKSGIHRGNYYVVIKTPKSWKQAKMVCEKFKGHLVTISNKEENDFVKTLLPENHFWIGLTDEVKESEFKWVTGEKFSFAKWKPGDPNNAFNKEHYVFSLGKHWYDQVNTAQYYFICEWDYASLEK